MTSFVVVAIFKNETTNLREWLDHWIWQGASAFFLHDHESTDNPELIFQEYESRIPIHYTRVSGEYAQVSAYINSLEYIQKHHASNEWVLFVDLDEFWYWTKGTIRERLHLVPKTIDVLSVKWKIFGPSEDGFQPTSLRTELVYRQECLSSPKYAVRTHSIRPQQVDVHHVNDVDPDRIEIDTTTTFCNHYYCQSLEYWKTVKIPRGCVCGDLSVYWDPVRWETNSNNCTVHDTELADQVLAFSSSSQHGSAVVSHTEKSV
jgi:hypothetical protein